MATPTLKYVAPTTPEDDLTFAPEPVVIYGVPSGGGGGGDVNSVNGKTGNVVLTPTDIGAADNAEVAEFAMAVQNALATKAATTYVDSGLSSKANTADVVPNTRTVAGKALSSNVSLVKADVGLGSVDNTSDSAKPISSATQAALDAKVPTSRTVAGRALTADVPRAALNTLGLGEAIFIPKNGTVPGGTPTYTIVIEAEA